VPIRHSPPVRASLARELQSEGLLAQISSVDEWARCLAATADRFIYFFGLISIGTLTYGIIGKHDVVTVLAFYALSVATCYQLQLYTDIEAYLSQREELEKRWNTMVGSTVFVRAASLGHDYRSRLSVRMLALLNGAPLAGLAIYGPHVASRMHLHYHLFAINIVGVCFTASVVVVATFENQNITKKVGRVLGRSNP
jgi:hypothetical protein